jgi:hypothetical protein
MVRVSPVSVETDDSSEPTEEEDCVSVLTVLISLPQYDESQWLSRSGAQSRLEGEAER